MSSSRATPVSAVMDGGVTALTLTFTEALVPDLALDPANWTVRYNNLVWNVTGALATGSTVILGGSSGGADAGPDVVSFAPPPDDVITLLSDLPVAPFADYPVT